MRTFEFIITLDRALTPAERDRLEMTKFDGSLFSTTPRGGEIHTFWDAETQEHAEAEAKDVLTRTVPAIKITGIKPFKHLD